jgi:hypothetical protein
MDGTPIPPNLRHRPRGVPTPDTKRPPFRASSIRRIGKLRDLITMLTAGTQDVGDGGGRIAGYLVHGLQTLAGTLRCRYRLEMGTSIGGASIRFDYTLTQDSRLVIEYSRRPALATIARSSTSRQAATSPCGRRTVRPSAGRRYRVCDPDFQNRSPRDPLVAAMFGPA